MCFENSWVDDIVRGPAWQYEVKLDGYRAIGVRTKSGLELWSRNKRDFSHRFREVALSLEGLPADTVLDGEIVAVNDDGKPSFSALQNFGDGTAAIVFYVFDWCHSAPTSASPFGYGSDAFAVLARVR